MNFTKTVPTEPGWYWIRASDGTIYVDEIYLGKDGVTAWHGKGFFSRPVSSYGLEFGTRVEPPQPVPGDVMEAAEVLQSRIARNELFVLSSMTQGAIKLLCDYIKSLAPPEVPPLKKPEWVSATWNGKPCYASFLGETLVLGKRANAVIVKTSEKWLTTDMTDERLKLDKEPTDG